MTGFQRILRALLFPHPVLFVLLLPAAVILLVYSFLTAAPTDRISLAAYTLSFYTLTVSCIRIPAAVSFILRFRKNNKYIVRYTSDVRLRVNSSLFHAFFFNGVYAVFQLCLGIRHASVWFYAMAAYYLLLAGMRLLLVRHSRVYGPGEELREELKRYRFCGVCLLLMNIVLAVILFYIIWQGRTFRHHEITTIAMAAYTFTALTVAIVNVIRYRRYESPVYSAAKAISLVSALVSMLTLAASMLTVFGTENSPLFRRLILGMTGTAVVLFTQGMAVSMIRTANRKLKELLPGQPTT